MCQVSPGKQRVYDQPKRTASAPADSGLFGVQPTGARAAHNFSTEPHHLVQPEGDTANQSVDNNEPKMNTAV